MKKKILLTIYIVVPILIFLYLSQYGANFVPMFDSILGHRDKSMFNSFKSSVSKTDDGYRVKLQNVVATASSGNRSLYVRLDLVIDTDDKKLAEEMNNNTKGTVATITDAINESNPEMLRRPEGKELLKKQIARSIADKYGAEAAKDIYFENFIYQ